MNEFTYRVIDVYDGDNLINGVLQHLPAYLTILFNTDAKYTLIAESPAGEITGEKSDWIRPGFTHQWRIPILQASGDWKIEIRIQKDNPAKLMQERISIQVPSELFEHRSDDYDSFEEDYFSEVNLPSIEEIQYVDVTSRLVELDAHWCQIDPELKLMRYIQEDTPSKLKEGRFSPILCIHGFNSDYTTWNWMVRYFWADGFRNIFAMDLYDDRLGVEKNTEKLEEVIDEVLHLTNHDSLYLIGHSLGGLISRYFVKKFDPRKVKLLVTAGGPHLCGLGRLWGKLFILLKGARITERDVTLRPSSTVMQTQKIFTEADFYQQTMVNICGTKIRGGDGGFKFKDNLVPDMVNLGVNYIHMSLIKNEDTYRIIRNLLFGTSVIYKIRLLYITSTIESPPKCKLRLYLKPKNKSNYQKYPLREFFHLESNEPYIPEIPMIVFTHLRNDKKARTEQIRIQVRDERDELVAERDFIFPLGDKKRVSDHFKFDSGIGYMFQFALYSYRLNYEHITS